MILEIFLIILFIGFVLVAIGYATDIPVFGVIGFSLIFMTGAMVFLGEVELKTGETINVTNMSDVTTYSSTNQYESLTGSRAHLFGVLLCVVGAFGFMIVYTTKDEEGYYK